MDEKNVEKVQNNTKIDEIYEISKIVAIVVCLVMGIFLLVHLANYLRDTQGLNFDTVLQNNMHCNITTQYNASKKEMSIIVREIGHEIEEWQKECFDKNSYNISIRLAENDIYNPQTFDSDSISVNIGSPLTVMFIISHVNIKEYVNFKKLILENKKNGTIQLTLPDIFSCDSKIYALAKRNYLEEVEREQEEKEAKEYAETMAYRYDNGVAVPFTGVNFRKCLFKVNGVCFGQPFFAKGMSYMDAKAQKDKLGIRNVSESDDSWATTVKICGGVKNLPTPHELELLANDMYNTNIANAPQKIDFNNFFVCKIFKALVQRDNSKPYLEYFRNIFWNNKNYKSKIEEINRNELRFMIYTNTEANQDCPCMAYVRDFATDYTGYCHVYRRYPHDENINSNFGLDLSVLYYQPISICVQRSK